MPARDPYQHPSRRTGAPAEPFFDLCTPAHAYLLGLLQTGGCHTSDVRSRGRISLELAACDIDLLHELVELVPWYSAVRVRERTTNFKESYRSATWTLCSWDARRELSALGLPPGPKSATITPPDGPLSERDYVRGLVDGDGSVGFTGTGRPFLSFVTTSGSMARYFEGFAQQVTGVQRRTNRNERDGVFNPTYQTSAAAALASHLYRAGDLALDRKAALARSVAAWERPVGMRRGYQARRWTRVEDDLVRSTLSVAELAARLDRTPKSISARRWRLRRSGA